VKYFIFIYFILICECLIVHGQNFNQHINIKAVSFKESFDKLYSFNIDIYRNKNDIKIVYSVLDSNAAKILFDSAIARYEYDQHFFYTKTDSVATKRSLYKKDSISFSQNDNISYNKLLDSCFLKDGHQFENKHPELAHTGGVFYHFAFEENGMLIKKMGAVLPLKFDYPILTRLITETFGQYKPNANSFLNRDNTNGRYKKL
jgi:hypothetical protein